MKRNPLTASKAEREKEKANYLRLCEKYGWKKPARWTKRRILLRKDEDHE